MPSPSQMPAEDLRRLVDERGAALGARFLGELQKDPRRGVTAIAQKLSRLLERARRERARRRRMLRFERVLWRQGIQHVAGVDEAGMGPLAGPVVAAAVVFEPGRAVGEADDSKQLDKARRTELAGEIRRRAKAWAIGLASVEEIAEHSIFRAGLLAMRRAVMALAIPPEHVLVDARTIPELAVRQDAHVRGDGRSCTIAAASVLAKVHRDALMDELAELHPGYGFEHHAGYATPEHLEALRRLGPCPAHRRSWEALADHSGERSHLFYELRDMLRAVGDPTSAEWRSAVQAAVPELRPGEVRRLDELARRHVPAFKAVVGPTLPLS